MGRRFEGIEGLPLDAGARGAGGGRMADDVVELTADAGEGGVAPGRYLVDYKAGERAFDLDQARRYAEALGEESDTRGILYVFTGRGEAAAAQAAARRAQESALAASRQVARATEIPVARRRRFLFAFLNEVGDLTWL